jgi:DegV family protein with EDD domain
MVRIVTDTLACLPDEIARQYQIPIIPQIIHIDGETYYEGLDIDIETFMRRLKSNRQLPKTAAPPPELFIQVFEQLVPTGEPVLCIHPSAEVSGTVRSAITAAQEFPGADIRVIDTRVAAYPMANMVEKAAELAAHGANADEIVDLVTGMIRRCRIYFLLDTLEFLRRGGRIGGASALLGNVLQVKPILTVKNGQVNPYQLARTYPRAVARIKELVFEQISGDGEGLLSVIHAGRPEESLSLAEELGKTTQQSRVPVIHLPPAIVTHGGPGILGVGFFSKA